jgi:predicted TIM-barrel fold metal-dependent hydrolase
MEKLTIVSLDGHAQMPPSAWPEYLEQRYHKFLPDLNVENQLYTSIMNRFASRSHDTDNYEIFDLDHAYRDGGVQGVWELDERIKQMDREGIAAEFIHNGDFRACGLFFQSSNTDHPMELCQAGVKGYNRWLHDTFGSEPDRLYLIGILGAAPWRSMDELLAELDWIADRGFKATQVPGYVTYPGQPPLFDAYWDPFWKRCEERGIHLWMHAGQGERQGELGGIFHRVRMQIEKEKGDLNEAAQRLSSEFNKGQIFASVKPRRAMWQIMMGGVFDRFPKLRLALSEVYGDWMPGTMRYLDEQYAQHKDKLPATRKPSEYWQSNCINGLSFIRRCEVELRHQIGVDTMAFGRDYPHGEGTWPNTTLWLRDALGGIPEAEARAIMADNAIRILGLDGAKIASIAARIGLPASEVFGDHPPLDPKLIAHFDKRAQYLAPAEGDERMAEIDKMMQEDLWRANVYA